MPHHKPLCQITENTEILINSRSIVTSIVFAKFVGNEPSKIARYLHSPDQAIRLREIRNATVFAHRCSEVI